MKYINTRTRVDQIIFKDGTTKSLMIKNSLVKAKIIVDAEGAMGRVLARSGIQTGQQGLLNGFNVELDIEYIEPNMVEVWFNQEIAKGFFTWVIPISENRVRCGLATSKNNGVETLRYFIRKRFKKEPSPIIRSGLICTGGPIDKTAYQGLVLVGDVAGQVKPTTAGGVVIGGLCAKLAGEVVTKALEEDSVLVDKYEKE